MTEPSYAGLGDGWILNSDDPRVGVLWPGSEDYLTEVEEVPEDGLAFVWNVARIQCEKFAPALLVGQAVPENYVAAQALQARALVRAGLVGSGDQVGDMGETVTVYPLDWTVKQLLRPKVGKPYFGGRRRL